MSNVFLDLDLIKVVSQRYDVQKRGILFSIGVEMVNFAKVVILKIFNLNLGASNPINFNNFREEYETHQYVFKSVTISKFRIKGLEKIVFLISQFEKEPFGVYTFKDYFVNSYYTLCQIVVHVVKAKMLVPFMYMKANTIVAQQEFQPWWHYQQCHKLTIILQDKPLDFLTFQENFVQKILSYFYELELKIAKEVLDFLRLVDINLDLGISHNWGIGIFIPIPI